MFPCELGIEVEERWIKDNRILINLWSRRKTIEYTIDE